MMKHDVEQMLKQDAEQMRTEQPPAGDFEQIRAIRAGMQQPARRTNTFGRTSKSRWSRVWVSAVATVTVIAILAGINQWNPLFRTAALSEAEQQANDNWGDLEPFRKLSIHMNIYDSLNSAIKNNYIQRTNTSVTQNGLTFTLHALTADRQKIIYFFTIESQENLTVMAPSISRFISPDDRHVISEGSGMWGGAFPENPRLYKGMGMIQLEEGQAFPYKMIGRFQLRTTKVDFLNHPKSELKKSDINILPIFKIPFDLAPQFSLQEPKIYYPKDLVYKWSKGTLKVTKVELSPLSIKIKIVLDPTAAQSDPYPVFPNLYLLAQKGGKLTPLNNRSGGNSGGTADDGSFEVEYEFGSDLLSQPDTLQIALADGQKHTLKLH
ncbi:DUF4179 domain-containing protein [Paenibacillus bovis]|uniref:DUF4179 domain-containing protein n=1 Tax=Paenibacillus bovis TaxID=1616788 RepID=A0A172ZIG2_9BACL|nr:DUF4179 domain-containing protein [Paenibacillus bovis]ANF97319.1 hypothetical protein AR543_15800 [Paenibacillus bovis]